MAQRNASMGTAIAPSLVSRIAAGFRYALSGVMPDGWMSPMAPIPPAVPAEQAQQQGVAGRQFDYPVGFNVNTQPRTGEAISFPTLRALADNYDLLRLVIETRKDQMAALDWVIRPRDKAKDPDQRCLDLMKWMRKPDQEHVWQDWLRMLLEDLLVIDAPTLYRRRTMGGELFALEPIDGATITRKVDLTGRTPMEGTAYQQVLKGVPAVDYTRDELIYRPRNVRTHRVYGYSPVEQIIMTVNTALRRQMFTLDYFTQGSVPDALAGVPVEWTTEQIQQFQAYWDVLMTAEDGDMGQRRRLKFVPGEIAKNIKETKQPPLKDMFDEWLARVVCFAFSVEPTPFVAQVNRSVAETAREQSLSEGLAPYRLWVKSVVDSVLEADFGADDLEFGWADEEVIDAKTKADINCAYINAKVLHVDEVRADLGKKPLTDEQKADMAPPAPVGPDGEPLKPGQPPKPGEKKPPGAGKEPPVGKASRPAGSKLDRAQKQLGKRIEKFLAAQAPKVAQQLGTALGLKKEDEPDSRRRAIKAIDELDLEEWGELASEVQPLLQIAAAVGAGEAAAQLGVTAADVIADAIESSKAWAIDRSAEMVGMKWIDGELVPNPDAKWQITEGTRDMLRAAVTEAIDSELTVAELADHLADCHAFSATRAVTIARTETRIAQMAGSRAGADVLGATHKHWTTAEDDKVSEECVACGEAGPDGDGVIEINDTFPSGEDMPPNHPNCRCRVTFLIRDDEEDQ